VQIIAAGIRGPLVADESGETARLVEAMGCRPIDIGPLMRARNLEAMAGIVIGLLFQGADPSTTFNLVDVTAR